MDRELAKDEIKKRWRELYPAAKKGGIVCPLCGNGSGQDGTGVKENPKSKKPHGLKCFKCRFSGDVIDLIQQERGLDFKAALEYAAAELNIPLDDLRQTKHRNTAAQDFKEANRESRRAAAPVRSATEQPDNSAYYARCREQIADPAAVSYLQARGISLVAAQYCGIGFDPEADPAGSGHKSPRIIIPVTKSHYVARSIDPATPKQYAKLNNKGAEIGIFDPVEALYNGAGAVFVTEGAIDALSIIEAGGEAIALNSTSNAEKLLKMLEAKPTAATLLLCLDNDEAGKAASRTLTEGLQRLNISNQDTSKAICGDFKDPNERLTAQGWKILSAAVTEAVTRAERPDNTSFYLDALMQGEIDKFREGRDRKTGFENLDKEAGGLYPGLYVVAATSSLGKTTWALQVGDQLAAAGHDVIFFSLEQSRLELVSKSLARITAQNYPNHKLTALQVKQCGHKSDVVQDAIDDYKAAMGNRLSIVEGNFNCDLSFIGDYVRRYIRQNGDDHRPVVIIDYLQILTPAKDERGRTPSTREAIDYAVTGLKRLSREQDITVICISSVNRANYQQQIDFEALKESGGIEYSADVVYGLQLQCLNEELFSTEKKIQEKRMRIRKAKEQNPREIELVCLKNRFGKSSFTCSFKYYPANDLFIAADE